MEMIENFSPHGRIYVFVSCPAIGFERLSTVKTPISVDYYTELRIAMTI